MNNITNLNSNTHIQKTQTKQQSKQAQKRELIDIIADNVKNPRDVNDCVVVPRGIFKAYISLMSGTGLMTIASVLPKKLTAIKRGLIIMGSGLNILSAFYFAKPFAITGLSPTVKKQ